MKLAVSSANPVMLRTVPLVTFIVMFWDICLFVPLNLKEKFWTGLPLIFNEMFPVDNAPPASLMF